MSTQVNVHEAKSQLSRLIEAALAGEEVIVARAGKPAVRLVPVKGPRKSAVRLGVLEGEGTVPEDFDTVAADEIADLFEGRESAARRSKGRQ